MPTVYFLGVVLPLEIMNISLKEVPVANCQDPSGLNTDISVQIQNSRVIVKCDMNRSSEDDFAYLYIRALDFARAAVDVITFASGYALSVHIHTFVQPDGTESRVRLDDLRLAQLCTAYTLNPQSDDEQDAFRTTLLNIFNDPALFMALNDLTQSISIPHCAPINCGRVLDALRKMIAPEMNPTPGWIKLQTYLQVDRSYTEWVSEQSKNPRHGDRSFVSGEITMKIVERTWNIMNRFFEFRKRNNQPLPPADFPLLRG